MEWCDDGSLVFKPNGMRRGNYVLLRLNNDEILLGQVVKFQYIGKSSKIQTRYTYDSVIFGINDSVECLLDPSYIVCLDDGSLKPVFYPYFISTENYICHIKENFINHGETSSINVELIRPFLNE